MEFRGFIESRAGHNLTTSSFFFTSTYLDVSQLLAFANLDEDHCQVDKIVYDANDKTVFKVFIKGIKREYITQNIPFKFHLIYTTKDGKIYKQTIEYEKETSVWPPQELKLTTFDISRV